MAAVVLVVVVSLALSHLPAASATLDVDPLGDPFARANDTAVVVQQPAAAVAPSPSSTTVHQAEAAAAPSSSPTEQQDEEDEEEKKKKKEKEKEKELEEIEKLKQEGKGLVSFTNGTGSYRGMSREFVDGHNKVRERYGVPAMKWNNKLARHARRWSNAMRKDCQLKHSAGNNYGESVFASPKSTGWNATAKDALRSWSSEEPLYDKITGDCIAGRHFSECGHFSLMVDRENQKIGCGRAECYRGGVFITCNYYLGDRDP